MNDAVQVGFEAWVRLSAQLLRRDPEHRALILEAAGLDHEMWALWDRDWTQVLLGDLERRDYRRAAVYARACAEEMQTRPMNRDGVPAPSPAAGLEISEDVSETVSLGEPSGLPPALQLTTEDAVPVAGPVLPFRGRCAAAFLAALPTSRHASHPAVPASSDETIIAAPGAPAGPVLPFGRGAWHG